MFGTQTVFADLVQYPYPITASGLDAAFDAVADLFLKQNLIVEEQVSAFIVKTTEKTMVASAPDTTHMQELDEFGTPNPQKPLYGQQVGFPLRKYGNGWQASFDAMEVMTGKELAATATEAAAADLRNVQLQIKTAFYRPTNYLFWDRLVDRRQQFQIPVKALANADGFPIPAGPNAELFNAATHNHFMGYASGSFVRADIDAVVLNVMEHHNAGTPVMALNYNDASTVVALMGTGFQPLVDVRAIQALSTLYINPGLEALDTTSPYNRKIGVYAGVDVMVKPWAIQGYILMWQDAGDKPLAWRHMGDGSDGLRLKWDGTGHPLNAKVYERKFGIGVLNRVGAAVLDMTHTTYTMPTFAAVVAA